MSRQFRLLIVVSSFLAAGTARAALEDDAAHCFQNEQAVRNWLDSLGDEPRHWLEGIGDEPTGLRSYIPCHLALQSPTRSTTARSKDDAIEWNTASVPADFKSDTATLVFLGAIGCNRGEKDFDLFVDGKHRFVIRSRPNDHWTVEGKDGGRLVFDSTFRSKAGEPAGYLRLTAPSAWLTPGKPLHITIKGQDQESRASISIFEYRDVAAWANAVPKPAVICQCQISAYQGQPAIFHFAARADRAGKTVELRSTSQTLGQTKLQTAGNLALAALQIPVESGEEPTGRLGVFIDDKQQGWVDVDPIHFAARKLLARSQDLAEQIKQGNYQPQQARAAAMVLAWRQLLEGTMSESDPDRHRDIRRRANSVRRAHDLLIQAISDFWCDHDTYTTRRGFILTGYISTADNSGQIYGLYVPPHYDPAKKYGLEVRMHGAGGWFEDKPPDHRGTHEYFIAVTDGRARNGYRGFGELDVLEVIRDTRKHYNIDPDRIWATGASMGGAATWAMCSRYPDLFAAGTPYCGWTAGMQLENLANLPIWACHDATDWSVPVAASRAAYAILKPLGYPITYTETTGGGHELSTLDPTMPERKWMHRQVRNPTPPRIVYTTITPQRGGAYWARIIEFSDPNLPATVHATVLPMAEANQLALHIVNVDVLEVSLPPQLFASRKDLSIALQGSTLTVKAPLPREIFIHRTGAGGQAAYALASSDPTSPKPHRPYCADGVYGMYVSGEKLMIVKATAGEDRNLLEAIDQFSRSLSIRASPNGRTMPLGQIPLKADIQVTAADIQSHNLILVGPASANRLLARITSKLPAVEKDGSLLIGGESYPLAERGYGFLHYNPEAPQRLIAVLSSPSEKFYKHPNEILERMNRESPLGLMLCRCDPPMRIRDIAWGKDWKIPAEAFDSQRLPQSFGDPQYIRRQTLQAICQATASDFAFAEMSDAPDDLPWDSSAARWHDLKTQLGPTQCLYTFILDADHLSTMLAAAKAKNSKLTVVGQLPADKLVPTARYRLVMFPWIAADLANDLHESLGDVQTYTVDIYRELRKLHQPNQSLEPGDR